MHNANDVGLFINCSLSDSEKNIVRLLETFYNDLQNKRLKAK